MLITRQQVETNCGMLKILKFDVFASTLEPSSVSQLPFLNKIQTSHHNKALRELDNFEALTPGTKWVTRWMVPIFIIREKSFPVPFLVLDGYKVFPIQSQLGFSPLLPTKHRVSSIFPSTLIPDSAALKATLCTMFPPELSPAR